MERKKQTNIDFKYIQTLDRDDIFNEYKKLFIKPGKYIYFGANTLGLMPKDTVNISNKFFKNLSEKAVLGWRDENWLRINRDLGTKISKIIGSSSKQVILSDSTSVNLFKILYSAIKISKNKKIILTDDKNFPTDYYIISSIAREYGLEVKVVPKDKLIQNINEDVSVISTTQVDYVTAEVSNIQKIAKKCKKFGVISLIDLSHSTGIIPLYLDKWGIDFAVGCTYKYLNGGPGSPAFIYVNSKHIENADIIIRGWFGHKDPFNFINKYIPSKGIERFLTGTPSIVSMKQLQASLNIFQKINMSKIREKSLNQTSIMINLILENINNNKYKIISPIGLNRGGHVAIKHENASNIINHLEKNGLIGDFRPPNVIRFGISPLYNSYRDVWNASKIINNT